ncbi:hypothetical protein ABPG75_005242 [Micractinium tetrahymenae]
MARFFRGGAPALKPEGALKRAEELISVGQRGAALTTLHDTITNKRHQRNWNKALEQVMFKYVDICVEMKAGRKCKDALINYRNACQQVNVSSLEDVIKYLIKVASDRAEAASKAAEAKLDVEDLEAEASPEEMMLSYVSGEKSKDRTDRELVTPWFKFLWETYRNVLDILRNNSRLEALYATAISRACQFCLTYKRTTEFRRLCDIVRNHLANLLKYRDQGGRDRTDLNVPATWELYVDTRFEQLRTACDLELWAEAFRSVEDIQGLMGMAPKGCKPRPQLMATYYAKLTQIFTKSESRLYSAYAWYRLFTFTRLNNKQLGGADLAMMASNVVLSALSILPYEQMGRPDGDPTAAAERAIKMAGILGFSVERRDGRSLLSREALLTDIERKGLLGLVPPEVKQLFVLLESEFNPLQLCKVVAPLLEKLQALNQPVSATSPVQELPLEAFVVPLQRVAVAKMVRQLSEVYSVMRVSTMSELAPFIGFGQAEQQIVDAVRNGYLQARFDHKNNTVHFGGQVESERVRGHIATMAKRLTRALAMFSPAPAAEKEARRARLVSLALETADKENKRMLARKTEIEKRKEEAERQAMERDRELEEQRQAAEQLAREAEERRKEQERARREAERIQRELEEREQEELKAYMASRGKKVGEGEKLDAKAINQEVLTEQLRQQQELQRKLAKLAKQMDHLERARREEEAPLLAQAYEQKLKDDEDQFHSEAGAFKAAHRAAWEADLAEKKRLAKLAADRAAVAEQIQARRAEEFAALKAARTRALAERREARRQERDLARRREYVRRCRLQIEEKRRAEEEEAKRIEDEKRKKEAAERQRKLDELAERQRQREAELEAKARADRESAAAAPAPAAARSGTFVPPHLRARMGAGGGGGGPLPERRDAAPSAGAASRDERDERGGDRGEERGGAWRPSARREESAPSGGGYRPPAARGEGGAYRPPGQRGGDDDRERGGSYRPPSQRGGSRW